MKKLILVLSLISFFSAAIFSQIPTNGLIAEWLFEDNILDAKPLGTLYNLNIIQGDTSYLSGKIGKALYLNGATKINNTDQNLVTFINNKNSWTIKFWFKYKSGEKPYIMGAKHLISIDQYPHASPYKRVWINTGDYLSCHNKNDNYGDHIYVNSINKIDDDKWYFASITNDSLSLKMYIDNVLQEEKSSINLGTESVEAFVIGSCSQSDWPNRDFYDGYIDQVRVYNRLLSRTEINNLFNEGKCIETVYDTTYIIINDTIITEIFDTIPIYDSIAVTDTLIIDVTITGLNPPDNRNTIKVYPNPTSTHIYIHTGDYSMMTYYVLKIIDQGGRAVYETYITKTLYEVNLSTWKGKGLYYLLIYDSGGKLITNKKIVLQ